MHLSDKRIEVLSIAEPPKPGDPNDDVRNRSVEQRNEPALNLVLGFTPFPAELRKASPGESQRQHACQCRAPHQPQNVRTAPIAEAAGMKNEKIEKRAERENQYQVNQDLHPRASRCRHAHLPYAAGRYTVRLSNTREAFRGWPTLWLCRSSPPKRP